MPRKRTQSQSIDICRDGPKPDIALPGWTALKNGDIELAMASGAVSHLGATALTRIS
jgi:hypothetical protein